MIFKLDEIKTQLDETFYFVRTINNSEGKAIFNCDPISIMKGSEGFEIVVWEESNQFLIPVLSVLFEDVDNVKVHDKFWSRPVAL